MSMSTRVYGVRELEGKFAKMLAAKQACDAAELGYPAALNDYFIGEVGESAEYLTKRMSSVNINVAVTETTSDGVDGFEVDLSKLPEGVKAIRFENSY